VIDGYAANSRRRNPGVKVKPIYAGNYDDARIKALAALKAASPPRSRCSFDRHLRADRAGVIIPGTTSPPPRRTRLDQVLLPGADDERHLQGKAYGIPFQRSTIVMYWNKDAFKEAGLDPEKAPANWTEMTQMAGKLVKKDASASVPLGRDGALHRPTRTGCSRRSRARTARTS